MTTCPEKTFKNLAIHVCDRCHFSCAECDGPNKNNCIKCDVNIYLINHICYSICPEEGYYLDVAENKCL